MLSEYEREHYKKIGDLPTGQYESDYLAWKQAFYPNTP